MLNLKFESCLKLILIISSISLISAYFIEYILGYQPCNLCLIESIPYEFSIILILANSFFKENEKFFLMLLILVFVFSFLISIYHLGIEQGFFEESSVCGLKNTTNIISKEELLKQLNEKNISCKDVTFKIFGLSLTSINMILSFIITLKLIKIYSTHGKNK